MRLGVVLLRGGYNKTSLNLEERDCTKNWFKRNISKLNATGHSGHSMNRNEANCNQIVLFILKSFVRIKETDVPSIHH